jgi:hypothetical protein
MNEIIPSSILRVSLNGDVGSVARNTAWMPHPWRFHGWAAMPMGSGDFADVKLCSSGLIDQNRAGFSIGVMSEAAPQPVLGLQD